MARARNIKPGFYKNEDLAECSIWARFIFPGLWMLADREGRLEDRPKRIKGELLPFDSQDVEPLLVELASRKDSQGVPFIIRYQNESGRFIQISKFSLHQAPHYSEKDSVIKPPSLPENTTHDEILKLENSGKAKPIKRGSQPPDSLIPDSLNPSSLNPDSLIPDSQNQKPPKTIAGGSKTPPASETASASRLVWNAYATAYLDRYGTEPVRNAKVNGQLANLVTRLPKNEAPAIAAWYVTHPNRLYVGAGHCVDLLLRDAEKLRTEWATGNRITEAGSRQTDRAQTTANAVNQIIAERGVA